MFGMKFRPFTHTHTLKKKTNFFFHFENESLNLDGKICFWTATEGPAGDLHPAAASGPAGGGGGVGNVGDPGT